MAEQLKASIESVSISELVGHTGELLSDELLVVSIPQKNEYGIISSYESKSISYGDFSSKISSDLDIGGLSAKIEDIRRSIINDSTNNYLSDLVDNGIAHTVISSIQENRRGQITSLGGYALSDALTAILSNIVVPKIRATDSPWAAPSTLTAISNDVFTNYIHVSSIVNYIGDGDNRLVASQSLLCAISNIVSTNYVTDREQLEEFVRKTDICSDVDTSQDADSKVASLGPVSRLSNTVHSSYPSGNPGEVYYFQPSGIPVKQTILDYGFMVCESSSDIVSSTKNQFPNRHFFSTSEKLSVNREQTIDALTWKYDDQNDFIFQTDNSEDGFMIAVLKQDYDEYDVTISCKITEGNTYGMVGVVAAMVRDLSGGVHTISFLRTTNKNYQVKTWSCHLDFGHQLQGDETRFEDTLLVSADDSFVEEDNNDWGTESPILIRVWRENNVLYAETTHFGSSDQSNLTGLLSVDLQDLQNRDDTGGYFLGRGRIGVASYKQASSAFGFTNFDVPTRIVDTRDNSTYVSHGGEDGEKTYDANLSVGVGRFAKNIATNKTFFVTDSGFIKFSEYRD